MPFFFVSAADGTNVVKVFEQAVEEAVRHRNKVSLAALVHVLWRALGGLLCSRRCVLTQVCRCFQVKEAVARGEFEDGQAGDLQFMAEVRDTLKYFEDKES